MARLARGKSLTALERYEDAERDLLAAVGVLDQDEARRSDARAALRALYGAWGRGAEAERWSDSALPAG